MAKKQNARERREAKQAAKKEQLRQAEQKRQEKQEAQKKQEERSAKPQTARQKSYAKAAGVRAALVVSQDVYLTSSGRGNALRLESRIAPDATVQRIAAQPLLTVQEVTPTNIMVESSTGPRRQVLLDDPAYRPGSAQKGARTDLLTLKPILEQYYFKDCPDAGFGDNIHIQIVHHIQDMAKILAPHAVDATHVLNTLLRDALPQGQDFIGTLSAQNTYQRYLELERPATVVKNRKLFRAFLNSPRLGYFGDAFFDAKGERRPEQQIYHIVALIGNIRQCCFHGEDNHKLGWLYDFPTRTGIEEYLETLRLLFQEQLDRVNGDFLKTNAVNITIAFETLPEIPREEIVRLYYDFIVTKTYKNLGFSVKKLREAMFCIPEARKFSSDDYATVRSKLYRCMDFFIFCKFSRDPDYTEENVQGLRAAMTDADKEKIYARESERLWRQHRREFEQILACMDSGKLQQYKKQGDALQAEYSIEAFAARNEIHDFARLIYVLCLFLDGKEINDLLTTLISKFDDIAAMLRTAQEIGCDICFRETFALFAESSRLRDDLNLVRNLARMQKPRQQASREMYQDAIAILGVSGAAPDAERIDRILAAIAEGRKDADSHLGNFIANNVIRSDRFHYLVRYCNPEKVRELAKNAKVVEFVLSRTPMPQIDRYYQACTGNRPADSLGEKARIRELVKLITEIRFTDFEDERLPDDAKDEKARKQAKKERNLREQKYKALISLYLTVMYQIVKNLVNVNARYVIGIHCLERDMKHYNVESREKPKDYRILTRTLLKGGDTSRSAYLARNNRLRGCIETDLANSDALRFAWEGGTQDAVCHFRNNIAHLAVIRDAQDYIGDIREIRSYFALYHYLMQRTLLTKCGPAAEKHPYFSALTDYNTYVKDLVKALCIPFGYTVTRFKNLSIEQLFDRNEGGSERADGDGMNSKSPGT